MQTNLSYGSESDISLALELTATHRHDGQVLI